MKLAVIDTETTSLYPRDGDIVEVALVEVDTKTSIIRKVYDRVCHPGGLRADIEQAWVVQQGHIPINEIMDAKPKALIAYGLRHHLDKLPWTSYNRAFDGSFLCRKPWNLPQPSLPCIMHAATWACKISATHDFDIMDDEAQIYKWPKLSEAHSMLLNGTRQGSYNAHRALDDAMMAAEVLLVLIRIGHFKLVESG